VVDGAQVFFQLWRQGFFLVELGLVGKLLALFLSCRNTFVGRLNGQIDVGFGLFLGQVDIFRGGVGVEQGLVAPPLLTAGIFKLLAPLVLEDQLSLLLRA